MGEWIRWMWIVWIAVASVSLGAFLIAKSVGRVHRYFLKRYQVRDQNGQPAWKRRYDPFPWGKLAFCIVVWVVINGCITGYGRIKNRTTSDSSTAVSVSK